MHEINEALDRTRFIHTLATFDRFIGGMTSRDHGLQQNCLCRMERTREKDQITLIDVGDESFVLSVSLSLYLFMAVDERTCSAERG